MQNIKTLAYRFLLETQINELNISVNTLRSILKKQNIFLLKYSEAKTIKKSVPEETYAAVQIAMSKNDAISLQADNLTVVLYSDDLPYGKKLQRIYHEVGHIKAEHRRTEAFMFEPNEEQEREADAFSFYVMAPPCIMKQIGVSGVSSEQNIASLTGLHPEHIKKALFYIHRDKGSKFLAIEKNLIHQFEQFINANKSNKLNIKKFLTAGSIILAVCSSSFYFYNAFSHTLATATPTFVPVVTTPQATPTPEEEQNVTNEIKSKTVWKSKTGDIYHTDPDCYHIPRTAFAMDLEDAISVGYQKCKDCKK